MKPNSKLKASQFLEKLKNGTGHLTLGSMSNELIIEDDVIVDNNSYNLESLELINVKFEGKLWFEHVNFGEGLILFNCTVLSNLVFENCKALNRTFATFERENVSLGIYGGHYSNISFKFNNLPFGANFKGFDDENLEIGYLNCQSVNSEKGGLYFEFVTVKNLFDLTGGDLKNSGLRLHNCEIQAPIRINSLNASSISFTGIKSICKEDIRIWSGKSSSITFNYGEVNGEVDITAVKGIQHLTLFTSKFQDKFIYNRKDKDGQVINFNLPEEIYIHDASFNNGFEFYGDQSKGEKLTINFSEKSSGVIDFIGTFFQEVILKGNNFNNSVFFRDCSFDKLNIIQLYNKSLLSFNCNTPELNDGVPTELKIENSNLGNTEFYDFDFSVYPIVRIIDSRIDNIYTFGVEWFKENQLFVDDNETSPSKSLSQKREIYRQLKLAAEKQSDKITSLFFKARELQMHKDVIYTKKQSGGHAWFQKISDLISIYLGKTNDHGQNWIFPLLWIIGITLAFYPFLMILSDSEITFAWNWSREGWNLFWNSFAKNSHSIPQLFNPARRLSDVFDNTNSFWLQFLDGLHRIILAFFIFQIVSAFRKFVK